MMIATCAGSAPSLHAFLISANWLARCFGVPSITRTCGHCGPSVSLNSFSQLYFADTGQSTMQRATWLSSRAHSAVLVLPRPISSEQHAPPERSHCLHAGELIRPWLPLRRAAGWLHAVRTLLQRLPAQVELQEQQVAFAQGFRRPSQLGSA